MQRSAICSHCSRVGSMPVGLCAQPAHQLNAVAAGSQCRGLLSLLWLLIKEVSSL